MDDKQLLNKARAVNEKFQRFKNFITNMTQNSKDLDNEILYLDDKLNKLNSEINILQIKITELDEKKCKLETDADELTTNMKKFDILKIHLAALNRRKQIQEDYSSGKGLKEQDILQNKIDNALEYFNEKNSKLDEEINGRELTLANRKKLLSSMYEKECNKYKKSIEQLKVENNFLSKKLNFIFKS